MFPPTLASRCHVCEGIGSVVWIDGIAVSAFNKAQEDREPCPACNKQPTLASRIASVPRGYGRYATTHDSCQCPDHQYRKRGCKHIEAVRTLYPKKIATGGAYERALED